MGASAQRPPPPAPHSLTAKQQPVALRRHITDAGGSCDQPHQAPLLWRQLLLGGGSGGVGSPASWQVVRQQRMLHLHHGPNGPFPLGSRMGQPAAEACTQGCGLAVGAVEY